jgi:hypothetical protein
MVKPHTAEPLREVAVSAHSHLLELMRVLRDAVARAVFIEEAIEEGNTGIAFTVAVNSSSISVRSSLSATWHE